MTTVQKIATEESLVNLNKKNRGLVYEITSILEENQSLNDEIANLKQKLKEKDREIVELQKNVDAKEKTKDYIKKIENELDRLPATRNLEKKVEMVRTFVAFALSVFDITENKFPFLKSARYGYEERHLLIKSLLIRFNQGVRDEYFSLIDGLKEKYPDGLPAKGIEIESGVCIKTLDDFVLKFLLKS